MWNEPKNIKGWNIKGSLAWFLLAWVAVVIGHQAKEVHMSDKIVEVIVIKHGAT